MLLTPGRLPPVLGLPGSNGIPFPSFLESILKYRLHHSDFGLLLERFSRPQLIRLNPNGLPLILNNDPKPFGDSRANLRQEFRPTRADNREIGPFPIDRTRTL